MQFITVYLQDLLEKVVVELCVIEYLFGRRMVEDESVDGWNLIHDRLGVCVYNFLRLSVERVDQHGCIHTPGSEEHFTDKVIN